MFQRTMQMLALALGTLATFGAQAAKHEKVTHCIELSEARSFKRTGPQFLYVSDAGQHYRVSFAGGECGEMRGASRLDFKTGEASGRICPKGSKLWANGPLCKVSGIEKLSAEDYQRLTRKRRT